MTNGNRFPLIKKKRYIIKQFKSDGIAFKRELKFYLFFNKKNLDFLPKLYGYSLSQRKLIIENVGENIKRDKLDTLQILRYEKILYKYGWYHNDIRLKNILFNENKNTLYLIDFEQSENKFTDIARGYGDPRNYVYSLNN